MTFAIIVAYIAVICFEAIQLLKNNISWCNDNIFSDKRFIEYRSKNT